MDYAKFLNNCDTCNEGDAQPEEEKKEGEEEKTEEAAQ